MNIVDSSGWLAYFADEPQAKHFHKPLNDPSALIVPTVTIYEVFKVVARETSENEALQAVAAMQKGKIADLTPSLAISAAKLSLEKNLPMADSIILATAKKHEAFIWTLDSDFKNIKGVNYFPKK
ncbi:MAG: type II toxin-antitoxin system VapC family toxin [Desulfobulbaceae bacterium]|nr:type II toxin-antitoxin system VapC family toxin [Desulfobulbaceae bacterium]